MLIDCVLSGGVALIFPANFAFAPVRPERF